MTLSCRDLRPLIGAYVLGALDAEETEAVGAHVATCQACAAEHSRLAGLPGLLTLAAGAERAAAEPPPAALEERLLDAVARETPARARRPWLRRPRLAIAAGLATAALAAAVAVAVIGPGGDTGGGRPPGYELTLQRAAAVSPSAQAWAELHQVRGGTAVRLSVEGLPPDPNAVYEVHCDRQGWSASAGTFRVDAHGRADVALTTAARRGQYDAIRVVRRISNAAGRPGEQLVFSASLS